MGDACHDLSGCPRGAWAFAARVARRLGRLAGFAVLVLAAPGCGLLEESGDPDPDDDEEDVFNPLCAVPGQSGFEGRPGVCPFARVAIAVRDELALPLYVEALEFAMPACHETFPCTRSSSTSFLCEVPWDAIRTPAERPEISDKAVELVGRLDGREYPRWATVRAADPDAQDACLYLADLSLPPPACAPTAIAAVEGRVLGVPEGAALQVRLWEPWANTGSLQSLVRDQPCDIDASKYRCPAMGDRSSYVLEISIEGEVIAQRDVYLLGEGCTRETLHYDVDPAACELEVWLGTTISALSDVDLTVSLDAAENAPGASCERVQDNRHLFRCPLSADHFQTRHVTVAGNGEYNKTASNHGASTCPAVQSWHVTTGSAAYGVPRVVLNDAEVRALSEAAL